MGPPSPAVAPWETFYRAKRCNAGFGETTFAMQNELRKAGLEVKTKDVYKRQILSRVESRLFLI